MTVMGSDGKVGEEVKLGDMVIFQLASCKFPQYTAIMAAAKANSVYRFISTEIK
jgi:hypothetical protein